MESSCPALIPQSAAVAIRKLKEAASGEELVPCAEVSGFLFSELK